MSMFALAMAGTSGWGWRITSTIPVGRVGQEEQPVRGACSTYHRGVRQGNRDPLRDPGDPRSPGEKVESLQSPRSLPDGSRPQILEEWLDAIGRIGTIEAGSHIDHTFYLDALVLAPDLLELEHPLHKSLRRAVDHRLGQTRRGMNRVAYRTSPFGCSNRF